MKLKATPFDLLLSTASVVTQYVPGPHPKQSIHWLAIQKPNNTLLSGMTDREQYSSQIPSTRSKKKAVTIHGVPHYDATCTIAVEDPSCS
jgi:hypothetical protein